ncbi:Uncharacterised protein [Enterobacter cloacae]|uniref:Uncharacterized protein n=1 Tax=Enterobacter cloacae TaxID=550 RepID=A0A377LYA5_ENTCL|nr:Uncharacterised protein [Enterobacter cloacae]
MDVTGSGAAGTLTLAQTLQGILLIKMTKTLPQGRETRANSSGALKKYSDSTAKHSAGSVAA